MVFRLWKNCYWRRQQTTKLSKNFRIFNVAKMLPKEMLDTEIKKAFWFRTRKPNSHFFKENVCTLTRYFKFFNPFFSQFSSFTMKRKLANTHKSKTLFYQNMHFINFFILQYVLYVIFMILVHVWLKFKMECLNVLLSFWVYQRMNPASFWTLAVGQVYLEIV